MKIEDLYIKFLECDSISTDTRKIGENTMFFALKGENFNGNHFTQKAIDEGAKYCIIDEKEYAINSHTIVVEDVLKTLQELATYHRLQLNIPIIALTGSNGKTTTKELINCVLSKRYNTTATLGNLNNHIGVPLTLLSFNKKTEMGIVEMGANHQKEIEFLCKIAQPNFGLITNFGKAHLEGFGGVEGVIKGKSELYDYLKSNKHLIFINAEDTIQQKQIGTYKNIYSFGQTNEANTTIISLNAQPFVTLKFNNLIINSNLTGLYNFNNIAVAIAIGEYFKVNRSDIKSAIESYIPSNNRSQLINKFSNTILLDAYNANPTSMIAALENFKQSENKTKVLFLGDMFELGDASEHEHQTIVNYLKENNIGKVHLVGKNFFKTNIENTTFKKFETFEDLKKELQTIKISDSFILIKGSRGMALERILEIL